MQQGGAEGRPHARAGEADAQRRGRSTRCAARQGLQLARPNAPDKAPRDVEEDESDAEDNDAWLQRQLDLDDALDDDASLDGRQRVEDDDDDSDSEDAEARAAKKASRSSLRSKGPIVVVAPWRRNK